MTTAVLPVVHNHRQLEHPSPANRSHAHGMTPWELAAAVAERQHLLITTWQASAAGIDRRLLASRVKREGLRRVHRGVIGWPGPASDIRQLAALVLAYGRPTAAAGRIVLPEQPDGTEVAQAIVAACLEAGQVVTGRSAAWLHGFGPKPAQHALWLPCRSSRVLRPGAVLRFGDAPPGTVQWRQGLPLFGAEAAIIETARTPLGTPSQREDELLWMLSRADSLRLVTLDSVDEQLATLGAVSGCDVLARAIARGRGTLSHSKAEARARELAAEALAPLGLSVSERPHEVFLEGRRVGEADIAVVPLRLDLEADGPHHRFADQRAADQERDRLMRRAGWEVERFPIELVHRPKVFKARVVDAAQARMVALGLG